MTDTLEAEPVEIDQLMTELRELVPQTAWQRIDDVLHRIVRLYSTGLEHALEHARSSGAVGPSFDELLCNDELLASLLVVHGLHPLTTEQRVTRAVDIVRAELGFGDDELVLAKVDEDGVVHLVAASEVPDALIGRVIETAAPEVTAIQIATLPCVATTAH